MTTDNITATIIFPREELGETRPLLSSIGRCPLWVKRVILAVRRPLPVYPDKQTFSASRQHVSNVPKPDSRSPISSAAKVSRSEAAAQLISRQRRAATPEVEKLQIRAAMKATPIPRSDLIMLT
jgi:hypothetical protein